MLRICLAAAVATTGLTCTAGVCTLGFVGDQLVKNFYFTNLGVQGQLAPPFTWSLAGGTLPPGLTLFPNGQAATQPFSLTISPQPPPLTAGQKGCQHGAGHDHRSAVRPADRRQGPQRPGNRRPVSADRLR